MFRCAAEGCSRTFLADRHLSQHKKSCPHVQAIRQRARELRRVKGLDATVSKDTTSLTDRKQRLQVSFYSCWMNDMLIYCQGISSLRQLATKSC